MKWIEKHLNWTYGIALIVGLVAVVIAILSGNVAGYIAYVAIIFVGGELILWRKGQLGGGVPILVLFPPLFAIMVLCMSNKRLERVTSLKKARS